MRAILALDSRRHICPDPRAAARWLPRHVSDPFVKQAQKDGYRSRSAYKLIELNEKDRLIRPGMRILDLGSAPGGWSQVAGKLVGAKGRVLATDILPMEPIKNVDFIQGDFTDDAVVAAAARLAGRRQVRPHHLRHRAEHHRHRFGRSGVVDVFSGAGARHRAQDAEARCHLRGEDVPGVGVGSVSEGAAHVVREGAHPQARRVARGVARGVTSWRRDSRAEREHGLQTWCPLRHRRSRGSRIAYFRKIGGWRRWPRARGRPS